MQRMCSYAVALAIAAMAVIAPADDQPAEESDDLPRVAYVDPLETLGENFSQSLEEPVVDAPLKDVAPLIEQLTGTPCRIANDQLAKSGISGVTRVSLASDVPIYMALDRLCLEELSPGNGRSRLAWLIDLDAGEIIFTTGDQAADQIVPFNFAVGDLSMEAYPEVLLPGVEFRDLWLIDTVQSHCDGYWIDIDGLGGEIDLSDGILQVEQTFDVQRRIDALLSALRKRATVVYVNQPAQSATVDQALETISDSPIESTNLEHALRQIAEQSDLQIEFEPRFIREHPAARRAVTATSSSGQPFRVVLDELLGEIDFPEARIGYSLSHGVVWVGYSEWQLETVLYNVADLVQEIAPGSLKVQIYETTNARWLEVNGVGGDISFTPYGYVIVTHSRQIQYRVRDLIEELRSDSAACEGNSVREAEGN